MQRHETVDAYIDAAERWQPELIKLREILNATALEETVKWGAPCYTHEGKNVVGLGAFKSYVGLWFFQGALLTDPAGVLVNAQEGRTKALRQWRFDSLKDIKATPIKAYVRGAIELAASGRAIKPDRNKPLVMPPQLEAAMAKHRKTATAFSKLSRGKQREYAEYIEDAKRDATKLRRIEKILPMIGAGVGLHDKYRNC